jgi:preprotein translocase subunit SecD
MKLKLTWRIWLWVIVFLLSLLAIFYNQNYSFQKGVLITSIEQNSSAFEQGLRQGQIIQKIDGKLVTSMEDFSNIVQEKFNSDQSIKITITTKDAEYALYSNSLNITVSELPKTNLKLGLDLKGGARALVQAKDHELTSSEVNDLVDVVSNRLNVYGISDMTIRPVSDLSGNNYMLIEIAGATPSDLESLISQQGKFEAKIGNETVFVGGERDITSVARSGQESEIYSCSPISDGYLCQFRFAVYLSQVAAERQAAVTDSLSVNSSSSGYLSKTLDLYVDNSLLDTLQISSDLKGQVTTHVSIQGSGTGPTQKDAYNSAQENMNKLQTILITGSLPFQLEIVKIDTISPTLGSAFSKYILIAGVFALLSVAIIVFIKYRKLKLVFPPLLICTSEIIITLGVAAVMGQDLDLPGIAGVLAAIGTGIDDQIVVLDEAERGEESSNLKQKIKRAFKIVMIAFFTSAVSLLPLLWAGAGLLKGFAIMSLIGISIGVLITRRAFADMIRIIEE